MIDTLVFVGDRLEGYTGPLACWDRVLEYEWSSASGKLAQLCLRYLEVAHGMFMKGSKKTIPRCKRKTQLSFFWALCMQAILAAHGSDGALRQIDGGMSVQSAASQ